MYRESGPNRAGNGLPTQRSVNASEAAHGARGGGRSVSSKMNGNSMSCATGQPPIVAGRNFWLANARSAARDERRHPPAHELHRLERGQAVAVDDESQHDLPVIEAVGTRLLGKRRPLGCRRRHRVANPHPRERSLGQTLRAVDGVAADPNLEAPSSLPETGLNAVPIFAAVRIALTSAESRPRISDERTTAGSRHRAAFGRLQFDKCP